jgi:hypothetical protein
MNGNGNTMMICGPTANEVERSLSYQEGEAMNEKSLTDAKEYFEQIVKGNVEAFLEAPSTFRNAFNAATSLFHQHEWLFDSKQPDLNKKYGQTFNKKSDFWKHVETLEPKATYIRDLANASKHVKLTIRPSTSMTHIANTFIMTSSSVTPPPNAASYSAGSVKMKDNGQDIFLDDCVKDLRKFWECLIGDLYP